MSKKSIILSFAAIGLFAGFYVGKERFAGSWIATPVGGIVGIFLGSIIHGENRQLLKLLEIVYVTGGGLILGWIVAQKYFGGSWIPVFIGGVFGFLLGLSNVRVYWDSP